ncbi:hypothetical protein L6R53_01915 [Myxococcota bacterium]|nr:hypothetical protein [Myxococcota bacterium]
MALASRGQRDMDTGPDRIDDQAVLAQVRRQARRVHLKALALATAMVLASLALPGPD